MKVKKKCLHDSQQQLLDEWKSLTDFVKAAGKFELYENSRTPLTMISQSDKMEEFSKTMHQTIYLLFRNNKYVLKISLKLRIDPP